MYVGRKRVAKPKSNICQNNDYTYINSSRVVNQGIGFEKHNMIEINLHVRCTFLIIYTHVEAHTDLPPIHYNMVQVLAHL